MDAKASLREEHGHIMKMLAAWQKILEKLDRPEEGLINDLGQVMGFLDTYIDRCHHAKEEEILFPALEKLEETDIDHLVAELRSDHRAGHDLLEEMKGRFDGLHRMAQSAPSEFIATSKRYINLFRKHIRRENARLLPMIEDRFSQEERAWIAVQFAKIEHETLGPKGSEAYLAEKLRGFI